MSRRRWGVRWGGSDLQTVRHCPVSDACQLRLAHPTRARLQYSFGPTKLQNAPLIPKWSRYQPPPIICLTSHSFPDTPDEHTSTSVGYRHTNH